MKKIVIAFACAALIFITATILLMPRAEKTSMRTHSIAFFAPQDFYPSIESTKNSEIPSTGAIYGAIVPHYLIDSNSVARLYATLSKNSHPKTIILIGPDHYDAGNTGAATTDWGFETALGVVNPDIKIIKSLSQDSGVEINNAIFTNEHSILSQVAYIKYYFPDARIVPLILRSGYPENKALSLGQKLGEMVNEDTLIIASIDFSHYLTPPEAEKNDEVTLSAMKSFDYDRIYTMNSDYFDTKAGLVAFLRAMEVAGTTKEAIQTHSNSGIYLRDSALPTTSYFMMYYTK